MSVNSLSIHRHVTLATFDISEGHSHKVSNSLHYKDAIYILNRIRSDKII